MKINNLYHFSYLLFSDQLISTDWLGSSIAGEQVMQSCSNSSWLWFNGATVFISLILLSIGGLLFFYQRRKYRTTLAQLRCRVQSLERQLEQANSNLTVTTSLADEQADPKPQAKTKPSGADQKLINGYTEYIEQNYMVPGLTSEQVAGHLFVTRKQLERKVKQWLGATPNQYLINVRLERAVMMLKEGKKIKEAYESCGFTSHAYFSKKFKEHYHCSPTDYINKSRD